MLSLKCPDALEEKGETIGELLLRFCFGLQMERKKVGCFIVHPSLRTPLKVSWQCVRLNERTHVVAKPDAVKKGNDCGCNRSRWL